MAEAEGFPTVTYVTPEALAAMEATPVVPDAQFIETLRALMGLSQKDLVARMARLTPEEIDDLGGLPDERPDA